MISRTSSVALTLVRSRLDCSVSVLGSGATSFTPELSVPEGGGIYAVNYFVGDAVPVFVAVDDIFPWNRLFYSP